MQQRHPRGTGAKYMLAGGSVAIAALGFLTDLHGFLPKSIPQKDVCQAVIQEKTVLSRAQLNELLKVPERSPKADVQAVMNQPYCRLTDAQLRSGAIAQREAYPLAFDPQTWFVVLYEGNEYAGYSFSFRHQ